MSTQQHMRAEVLKSEWLLIETTEGTEALQLEYVDADQIQRDDEGNLTKASIEYLNSEAVQQFFSGCYDAVSDDVETRTGYGARLSAQGYLDATDWRLFDSVIDAANDLLDSFDVCLHSFIPCNVKEHHTAYIVTFDNGSTMLLQNDLEQLCFAKSCGLITDDNATTEALADVDLTDIQQCSDEYLSVAEFYECPKCGGNVSGNNYNDGRCDRVETTCDDCDWSTGEIE